MTTLINDRLKIVANRRAEEKAALKEVMPEWMI